jgi:alpha-1,3-glucosyltransferase
MGTIIKKLSPAALQTRGYMNDEYKYVSIMRLFVVLLEFAVFVPGYLKLVTAFSHTTRINRHGLLFGVLMIPPVVFVDHGHFQFNQVMHGLVVWGIAFMFSGQLELAVIAMVLAINFKQMALYFALPFGVYALTIVWKRAAKG